MAQAILEQATANGLEDQIADVMVPTEEVVEVRRGAKVQAERKFFPGYILVNMELTDAAWSVVQSQPRVTGFLGGKGRPVPITNAEAERLIKQMDEGLNAHAQHCHLMWVKRSELSKDRLRASTVWLKKQMTRKSVLRCLYRYLADQHLSSWNIVRWSEPYRTVCLERIVSA